MSGAMPSPPPAPAPLRPSERARLILGASVVATMLLYLVPFGYVLAYPLMLLSTLVHEMGHGIAALLVGGSFHQFQMFQDGSGVAMFSIEPSRLRSAIVAAGGLVGPALAAAVGFAAGRTARGARRMLSVIVIVLALAFVLVVRNSFGWLFVGIFGLCLAWVARRASAETAQLVLVFLSVQLSLSVFSRGDYLFTPVARTAKGPMPSDVGQIAQALFLPYWFWGAVCGLFSVWVLIQGLRAYWK